MPNPHLTTGDLISEIAQRDGRPYAQTAAVIRAFVQGIVHALAEGRSVGVTHLGTFCLRKLGRRRGRDPRTGQTITFGPTVLPWFRPSDTLKAEVRGHRSEVSA